MIKIIKKWKKMIVKGHPKKISILLIVFSLFLANHAFSQLNLPKGSLSENSREEQDFLKDIEKFKNDPGSFYQILSGKWGLNTSPSIRRKWEKYLKEVDDSDVKTEKAVFVKVYKNYLKALSAFDQKVTQCQSTEVNPLTLTQDLHKQFGKDYIKSHESDVVSIVFFIKQKKQWECEQPERRYLLEAEKIYYSVLNSQLKNVISFLKSDTLTIAEKQKFESRIPSTQLYLKMAKKYSMTDIIFTLTSKMLSREERLQLMPKRLVNFIKAYPAFSKSFQIDIIKLMDYLKK